MSSYIYQLARKYNGIFILINPLSFFKICEKLYVKTEKDYGLNKKDSEYLLKKYIKTR